jgi:kinesin family protein C1
VTELEAIRARLESVNKDLETDLKDAKSCMKTMEMEMEMTKRNTAFEADDTRRKYRNEIEDLENKHEKATRRWQSEKEAAEEKVRKNFEAQIDKLLKEHKEQLDELNAKLSKETEAERNRQLQKEQEVEAEYASKLRAAGIEADAKQRELQLIQGDLTNVKSELDRERALKSALQGQLTEATTKNLTLESSNTAMKEKINFLESDSQAQSSAYNDLHRRMQEAIEAAEQAHEKLRQEETLRRKLFNQVQELKGNIRVMCRVRPAHASESDPAKISFPDVDTDSKEVAIQGPEKTSATGKDITAAYQYSFDRVFGPKSQNLEVFDEISQLVQSALDGYNVCIFCYGQTGSGKTYTMSSPDGMIPLASQQIYAEAKRLEEKGWRYKIEGSFIEVYNETYNDLLGRSEDLDKKKVEVRHDPVKKQTNLENTVSMELDGPDRVTELLKTADKNRTVAATKANMRSSRSHSVFILKLVGTNEITGERSEGTLNLVDLAGSERLEHSKVEGARLKETQNINKSLSCLGDVINALGSAKEGAHIPYRNSKVSLRPRSAHDTMINMTIVDLPPPILTRWQLKDTHVCHGQPAASTSAGDGHQSQVRDQGAQHTHWYCEEADQDSVEKLQSRGRLRVVDEVRTMVLLVYVFFPQRFLKCSRPRRYHICWTSCGASGAWKEHLQPMAGSPLMTAHCIGVVCLLG